MIAISPTCPSAVRTTAPRAWPAVAATRRPAPDGSSAAWRPTPWWANFSGRLTSSKHHRRACSCTRANRAPACQRATAVRRPFVKPQHLSLQDRLRRMMARNDFRGVSPTRPLCRPGFTIFGVSGLSLELGATYRRGRKMPCAYPSPSLPRV